MPGVPLKSIIGQYRVKHVSIKYDILACSHTHFSLLLSFLGPYRRSSKDSKCSFVPFAITVGGEMYEVRVLEPIIIL